MGDSQDSILKRVSVTLADGNEYDLHYPIASLIFLSREYSIDLLERMSGPGMPVNDKGEPLPETDEQKASRMARNEARIKFVMENIDRLVMAGLIGKNEYSTIAGNIVRDLPVNRMAGLVNSVFSAILRDLAPEKEKPEVVSATNPPDAALTA